MKQNATNQPTYFRAEFERKNYIREWFNVIVLSLCSYPRLLIEVFIRSELGERYGSPMSMATVGIALLILPWTDWFDHYTGSSTTDVIMSNKMWFCFVAAYAIFAVKRWMEIRRAPSVFDFGRYSKSTGSPFLFFVHVTDKAGEINYRLIEIWLEPLMVFIVGFLFSFIDSHIALLLMSCAIIYSFSYMAAYNIGDNEIMKINDQSILNEEIEGIIIKNNGPDKSRGVRIYGKRPSTEELRRRLLDNLKDKKKDDDDDDGVAV